MTKLGKIAIVGAAVGAGVYLAQKCMPKMSVFFAHEDDDDMDEVDETEDVKDDEKEDACDGCDGHLCEIHAIPLSEAPADVRAVVHAIDDALRQYHAHADAEDAESAADTDDDEDLNVEDYGLTDEDFEDLDMLFESDNFEQPDGKFEEPYFTV